MTATVQRFIARNGATATLYLGDNTEVLKMIAGCHACVTDPPYSYKFMGRRWDYELPTVAQWALVLAALLPGAHLLSAGGPRTYHRLTCGIEDAGFDVRDCIMHIFGSGFPKSKNLGNGIGSNLKPAYEPWTLARKPCEGTLEKNYAEHGTGGLNIDASRIGTEQVRTHIGPLLRYSGQNSRPGHASIKKDHADHTGRWPANLLLSYPEDEYAEDGTLLPNPEKEEVLDAFAKFGERKSGGSDGSRGIRSSKSMSGVLGARTDIGGMGPNTGSAARFFFCAKSSKADRGNYTKSALPLFGVEEETFTNSHITIKPLALMRYLCKLVTPPGGTVLDSWMGSGSTGVAALKEGFSFIGIERDLESFRIACERMRQEAGETQPAEERE